MGRLLVIQHVPTSSLGVYGDVLAARGDETVWIDCEAGDEVPGDPEAYDGVISLGGPFSLHLDPLPWLDAELALLRAAVESGTPVFGVCLGAQLLAAALGAPTWTGPAPEVGVHPITLEPGAAGDPLFGALPPEAPMWHWHGDSFDLPEGAVLLASSDAYRHQAFRVGDLAYGCQFHAESTLELVRGWIELPATRAQLDEAHGPGASERVLADARRWLGPVNDIARRLMLAWREAADG